MHHYFETYGAGEPLILLHGNGEDCTYFKHQIPAFAKYYKVYAIDTRGHGKTPRGDGEFSIRRFAEDLYDFFEWQKIPKAHILGFSDGANIAMYFALAHPERINKLILNGGNIFPTGLKAYFNVPCQVGYRLLKPIPFKNEKVHHFYELRAAKPIRKSDLPRKIADFFKYLVVQDGTVHSADRSAALLRL